MMFLMQLPAASASTSVHPGLPVPCSSPVMGCAERLLLSSYPYLRVSADSFRAIPLLTTLCSWPIVTHISPRDSLQWLCIQQYGDDKESKKPFSCNQIAISDVTCSSSAKEVIGENRVGRCETGVFYSSFILSFAKVLVEDYDKNEYSVQERLNGFTS